MALDPSEKQYLAALNSCVNQGLATDLASLAAQKKWYSVFVDDWGAVHARLLSKRLIEGSPPVQRLTAAGEALGAAFDDESPELYHDYYQKFYPAAFASQTHSRFCERVFGKDLCQDGQVDMAGLHAMIDRMGIGPGQKVLDIGCGAGAIAAYIAKRTGAHVTALDLAETAMQAAKARHADQADQVQFIHGDIDSLDFVDQSFDAILSIDSLYWVADLKSALARIARLVKPGGQMGIFMEQSLEGDAPAEVLKAENTDLTRALNALSLDVRSYDYSLENRVFWTRIREAIKELSGDYDAEGYGFIAQSLGQQAAEFLPQIEKGRLTRYFYQVHV